MINGLATLPAPKLPEVSSVGGTGASDNQAGGKSTKFQSLMGDMAAPATSDGLAHDTEAAGNQLDVEEPSALPVSGMTLPLPIVASSGLAGVLSAWANSSSATAQAGAPLQAAMMSLDGDALGNAPEAGNLMALMQRVLNKAAGPVSPALMSTAASANLDSAETALWQAMKPEVVSELALKPSVADLFQLQLQSSAAPSLLSAGTNELSHIQAGGLLTGQLVSGQLPGLPNSNMLAPAPIGTPIQQPQWGAELGNRLMWMVQQNVQTAEIKLNPPHLGPMEVRVSLANESVSVTFTSHHAMVRDALDAAMPRLRDMLMDNGLQLADANVSNKAFSEQRDSGQGQQNGGLNEHRALSGTTPGGERAEQTINSIPLRHGFVDYYA